MVISLWPAVIASRRMRLISRVILPLQSMEIATREALERKDQRPRRPKARLAHAWRHAGAKRVREWARHHHHANASSVTSAPMPGPPTTTPSTPAPAHEPRSRVPELFATRFLQWRWQRNRRSPRPPAA